MSVRAFRRAVAVGAVMSILATGIAFADAVVADGDVVATGVQDTIDLGQVAPGSVIEFDVSFSLECGGTKHVNSNQFVILTFTAIAPAGGDTTGTNSIIAPPGSSWPADFSDCTPAPDPIQAAPSHVTITAPTQAGDDYSYLLMWTRTLNPMAAGDSGTFSGGTSVTVTLDVGGNTAPAVTVPNDMVVEGNTTGGATVAFTATATDAEDDPDPSALCQPASGSVFTLGTTTVSCQATDSGGLIGSAEFSVTVVDTTAPSLVGVPAGVSLTTTDPGGTVATYAMPSAIDVVDQSPSVDCLPASGSVFPVGYTTVTCTARDDTANEATRSFVVHVTFQAAQQWSAVWDEPIGDSSRLSTGGGRTIPVKVRMFVDGAEVTSGSPVLEVSRCSGGATGNSTTLTWGDGNGRWSGHLDTSGLTAGCYRVAVMVGDAVAGSFTLDVGPSSTAAKKAANSRH
jgi:hypothetical protein